MTKPLTEHDFDKQYCICLIGDSGSGKTTTAVTAPGKLYIFAFEDGLQSLRGLPKEDLARIFFDHYPLRYNSSLAVTKKEKTDAISYMGQSWEEAKKMQELLSRKCEYDCVIVDSLTAMTRVAFEHLLVNSGHVNRRDGNIEASVPRQGSLELYQKLGMECSQFYYGLYGLPCAKIFIGHEDCEKDDKNGQFNYRIAGEGRAFPKLLSTGGDFDEIWKCLCTLDKNNEPSFQVQLRSEDGFRAKSRWARWGKLGTFEEPNIAKILEKVRTA